MVEIAVATLVGLVLVVGPLVWRVARDRSEARALGIRAYVQSLVDRKLGGARYFLMDPLKEFFHKYNIPIITP